MAVAAAVAALLWAVVALVLVLAVVGDRRAAAEEDDRWRSRPLLSRLVVVLAHVVPIAAAVGTSATVSSWLPEPHGWSGKLVGWGILLAASTAVLVLVDRVARRLLPLAALLKLSMLFPDRAPTRMRVARKAGSVRNLHERIEHAKQHGVHGGPAEAAETILTLVGALHAHDRHTRGHSERVRMFTDLLADEMKLPAEDRDRLRWASLLHDIGKLHVPAKILNKSSKLSDREWEVIHRHPVEGATLARPLLEFLGEWAATIEQHHERYDGTGYPYGLRGEQISLGARIVAVADSYEVMTAVRPYKKAMSASAARKELTRCAGTHFDPEIVRAFLNISIGRLRWAIGPVAWVAQVPFVGWVPRLVEGAAAVSGQAAGVVGTAAGMAVLSTSGIVGPPSEEAPPAVPAAEVVVDTPPSTAPAGSVPGTAAVRRQETTDPTVAGVQLVRPSSVDGAVEQPLPDTASQTAEQAPGQEHRDANAAADKAVDKGAVTATSLDETVKGKAADAGNASAQTTDTTEKLPAGKLKGR